MLQTLRKSLLKMYTEKISSFIISVQSVLKKLGKEWILKLYAYF